jgi:hypothetical protein
MSYGSSANWLMKARFFDRFGTTRGRSPTARRLNKALA